MKLSASETGRMIEGLKKASREAGVKLTHQRLEILGELASRLDHPDADAIFRAVRERMPTISLDTVYRTLRTLEGLGLIRTLGPRRDSLRFDANVVQHHHYVCIKCGLVRDFESEELNTLHAPPGATQFGTVTGAQVEFRGICDRCEGRRAGKSETKGKGKARGDRRRRP